MSWQPALEPECRERPLVPSCRVVIEPRARDIGAFQVKRVLPSRARAMVGPFIFFDEMGPAELAPGEGLDVRPHPHIGLATLTYLFEGEILHRDSLGMVQPIQPGAVNWMVAGRGIAHSERSPDHERQRSARLHGIQTWVALPAEHEDAQPSFEHHPAESLPAIEHASCALRLLAGTAYGQRAPVRVLSPMFYVHAELEAGASLELPDEHPERALYVVDGAVELDGDAFEAGRLVVFEPGARPLIHARAPVRAMLLGGAPLESRRHVWWNFVASSMDRIERARAAWRDGAFPAVPGDPDRIPLPE